MKYSILVSIFIFILTFTGCGSNSSQQEVNSSIETSGSSSNSNSSEPNNTLNNITKNNIYFYSKHDDEYGNELWVSDGNSTRMVKDIRSETESSGINSMFQFNDHFVFSATDGINGVEPYISDGTPEGTQILKDIRPGAEGSYPSEFIIYKDKLYFSTILGLYCSDGTEEGTEFIYEFSSIFRLTVMDNKLYFIGNDSPVFLLPRVSQSSSSSSSSASSGGHGEELWTSDGTPEGTYIVKDIHPGSAWGVRSFMHQMNGYLYFGADDGIHGVELWKSDGTETGTAMVKDINTGSVESHLSNFNATVFKDNIYFIAFDGTDIKIWSSDGTTEGTKVFLNKEQSFYGELYLNKVAKNDTTLYFSVNNAIYESDGTSQGTKVLLNDNPDAIYLLNDKLYLIHRYGNIVPGQSTTSPNVSVFDLNTNSVENLKSFEMGSDLTGWTEFDNELYFIQSTVDSQDIYKTDGTKNGTIEVYSLAHYTTSTIYHYNSFLTFNNQLFISLPTDMYDIELWRTDGTEENTQLFKDINTITKSASPKSGVWWDNNYYFIAYGSGNKQGLYKTDGTEEGTNRIKIFDKEGALNELIPSDDFLLLRSGNSLWSSQGTEETTVKILDNGDNYFYINQSITYKNKLFFFAYRNGEGRSFWVTDGTEIGTEIVYSNVYTRTSIVTSNNKMFFVGRSDTLGNELFVSDGTISGTHIIKDINSGSADAMFECPPSEIGTTYCYYETNLYALDDTIYFGAYDGENAFSIWKTDGTLEGTKNIDSREIASFRNAVSLNNALYYISNDGNTKMQLNRLNNTMDKPEIIKTALGIEILRKTDNLIFLRILEDQNSTNNEFWKSDGSSNGTVVIDELDSWLKPECSINDTFFYMTGSYGNQLWATDGTLEGTFLLIESDYIDIQNCHILENSVLMDIWNLGLYVSDGTTEGTKPLPIYESSILK